MKIKRWTATCVAVIFLLSASIPCFGEAVKADAGTVQAEVDTSWYTEDPSLSEYCISTSAQLLGFATLLGKGSSFAEQTVKLGADITVNDVELSSVKEEEKELLLRWPAINQSTFQGTIDGQGHTISGIYYPAPYNYVGLFGNVAGGVDQQASVVDLSIVNCRIEVADSNCRVGVLFGNGANCGKGLTLRNLYVDADVICEGTPDSLGGLVGRLRGVPLFVDSCVVTGNLSAEGTSSGMGGVIGYSTGAITVSDSGVFGSLQASSGDVGGMIGACTGSLSITRSVSDGEHFCEGATAFAFYGKATGAVTLENLLYTHEELSPIPNASSQTEAGKYALVESASLRGSEAMAVLSRYGWSGWRAVLDGVILPIGLLKGEGESESEFDFCTKLVGYQTAKGENGTVRLRLVAVVDSLRYSAIGFSVNAHGEQIGTKNTDKSSTTVYSSLLGETDGTVIQYTAKELGGAYIFALNINNIPLNAGEITFEVATYHVRGGQKIVDGEIRRFTLNTDDLMQ